MAQTAVTSDDGLTPDGLPPVVTVAVLDGRYTGSLAYALRSALARPARVSVVRLADDDPLVPGQAPLQVDLLTGEPRDALVSVSDRSDVLVVQSPADAMTRLTDERLVWLRRNTRCLLLEVDEDGEVLRASGPLTWVVAAPAAGRTPGGAAPVVVAGVDGSVAGGAAVEWAREMAVCVGATLKLVAVAEPSAPRSVAERALRDARALSGDTTTEVVVVEGEPVDVLVRESAGAVMLVVGRHRTSGMLHSVMGGTGDSCARLASCPVVIVPSEVTGHERQTGTDQATRVPPPAA